MECDELENYIESESNDKDLANGFPAALESLAPMLRLCEQGPEIGRFAIHRVLFAVAQGEEARHQRLHQEPEMHRSVQPLCQTTKEIRGQEHLIAPLPRT